MKNTILIITGILLTCNLKSQVFYDEHFHKVNNKIDASYYRQIDTTESEIIEKTYWINDSIYEITHYARLGDRIKQGKNYQYYKTGKLKYDIDFSDNKLNGVLRGYFENGNIRRIDYYKNDSLIKGNCYSLNGSDTTYYIYMKNANYKGQDLEGFRRFILTKLKYPPLAIENNIQGKVIVEFDVNSRGEVENIYVVESPDDLLSKEAIRAVNKSDIWEPCIFEGKKARQRFAIPIYFNLD